MQHFKFRSISEEHSWREEKDNCKEKSIKKSSLWYKENSSLLEYHGKIFRNQYKTVVDREGRDPGDLRNKAIGLYKAELK